MRLAADWHGETGVRREPSANRGWRFLYDRFYEAEFARPNLDTHLQRLFHEESELIAVVLCAEYNEKEWCGLEWRAIRDRIKNKQDHAIMLLRFDDADVFGLYSIDGHVEIGSRDAKDIAMLILERIKRNDTRKS